MSLSHTLRGEQEHIIGLNKIILFLDTFLSSDWIILLFIKFMYAYCLVEEGVKLHYYLVDGLCS